MAPKHVTVDGQQLAYDESSGSGRPVVFVHGNSSSRRTWQGLVEGPFGERFRALAFDLPAHGDSAPAKDYSLGAYAAVLRGFLRSRDAENAVVVGWSLGGHIALEAAPDLPDAPGFVIFGTPPAGSMADMGTAFLPNHAVSISFTPDVDEAGARQYAESFLAPGSDYAVDDIVAAILATDGAARAGLGASLTEGRFRNEVEIVGKLRQPLAILHGEGEQLVNVEYLRGLTIPSLWRGEIQLLPGAGHAPHLETPKAFAAKLEDFLADVG